MKTPFNISIAELSCCILQKVSSSYQASKWKEYVIYNKYSFSTDLLYSLSRGLWITKSGLA